MTYMYVLDFSLAQDIMSICLNVGKFSIDVYSAGLLEFT